MSRFETRSTVCRPQPRMAGLASALLWLVMSWFVAASPGAAAGEFARAQTAVEAGRLNEALPLLDAVIVDEPDRAAAYLLRGIVRVELEQWEPALADYNAALRLDPNSAEAWYRRGYWWAADAKDRKALPDYDQAIRLDPGNADYRYARATAYERLRDWHRAAEAYREVLAVDPSHADAERDLQGALAHLGPSELPPTTASSTAVVATATRLPARTPPPPVRVERDDATAGVSSAAGSEPAGEAPQAQVRLLWPDADHVRPPGTHELQGSYQILDPTLTFGSAGFIVNNTPYPAGKVEGRDFSLRAGFNPGEYLIEAYVLTDSGQRLPGEAYRLYIREAAELPPETPQGIGPPPVVRSPATPQPPASASMGPSFKGEGFEAYLEFDGQVDGQPHGSFFSFPPRESGLSLRPEISWNGNRFEGSLRYEKPASEIWDDRRKTTAKLRWEVQYRVLGSIAADQQSLEGITLQYKAECRMDDGTLWEYYEGSYALTNVPGQGRQVANNNPRASGGPEYVVEYKIEGNDRTTLDHVLELSYRHGFPSAPETGYQISTATLSRVNFRFTGW